MVVIMAYQTCEVEGSLGELTTPPMALKEGGLFKYGHVSRDCYVLPASF